MNYETYDAQLTGRNALSRKVANNTWAERRGDDTIAIRLHNTDVVTYHRDGRIQLFTGGWYTVTTKARMNAYSPARVYSIKGRWYVREGGWDTVALLPPALRATHPTGYDRPFAEGITIHPDGTITGYPAEIDVKAQDRAIAKTRRDINRFIGSITPERIVSAWENTGGDCFLCRFGEGSCLADHVKDNYFHAHLALRAVKAKGYGDPNFIMSMIYSDAQNGRVDRMLTDSLRKLLVTNLIEGVAVR